MRILPLLLVAVLWAALYAGARFWSAVALQPSSAPRWFVRSTLADRLPFVTEFIAAAGGLALATVGFFWQILLTPNAWMPAGGGDLAPFLYPNYRFAAEQLRQGTIPLWNPHLYSGVPFAADIQAGLFYPINLLV
ncbi:MAG: hypothetical protein AB1801_28480, partial [Chloroflexota bacterium]